jgi:hypothetical protein
MTLRIGALGASRIAESAVAAPVGEMGFPDAVENTEYVDAA